MNNIPTTEPKISEENGPACLAPAGTGGEWGSTHIRQASEVEPWPEPVEGALLLQDLAQVLTRFVVLPKWAPETLALWALHTYAFELRDVSAYLGIESPEKRCGKTTLLSVLSKIANRPVAAANISSQAFFRVIQDVRPTLLIDEADTLLQGNDELRGILNAGYTRETAYVMRVTNQTRSGVLPSLQPCPNTPPWRGSRLASFSCWCPKVMAAIGRLPETLADRCIVIRMQRKLAGEPCERVRNLDTADLRRMCARFVIDNGQQIAMAQPQIPPDLNDRAADIWEPLMVLADLAGGAWPQAAREAAVGLTATAHQSSPIGALLLDILLLFTLAQTDRIFSRELVAGLNGYQDRPWRERSRAREISENWLAQQLRPYGVRPRTMRICQAQAKGYALEDFGEVFRRYIPRCEFEALKAEMREANQ